MQNTASKTNINTFAQHKAFIDSTSFCRSFLKEMLIKTFEGVGLQNASKMAPKTASLQSAHILTSFASQGFTQKLQPNIRFKQDKDFKPPGIDNLAVQQIVSQKPQIMGTLPQIVEQASSTKSRIKSKKTFTQSIRSRKFTQISEQLPEVKSKELSQFQKLPQVINQFDFGNDPELNKVRANYFNIEKQNLQREKELKALREKNLIDRQKNQKIMKDMKRITYDYEGKLFGQGTGISQPQKLMALTNKYGAIKNTTLNPKKAIQQTTVDTSQKKNTKQQKKDIKEAPMFRDKAQSIIETIETTKGISAGVKIIQELSEKKSVTKENPLKKPSINSLADFKNTMKESRFREYHPISLNKEKSSMKVSSIANQQTTRSKYYQQRGNNSFNRDVKSKSSYSLMDGKNKSFQFLEDSQSSRIDKSIIEQMDQKIANKKVKYRGLPFIKTKGFRAIDIASEKSFKLIVDDKAENSRHKIRNKIFINDINLLKLTLQDLP